MVVGVTDLICFVVVLWVVLEHFWFLLVFECLGQAVCAEVFAPFFVRNEPGESVSRLISLSTPRIAWLTFAWTVPH